VTIVTLRLTLIGPSLFVIVLDEGPGAPSLQQPAELDEDGRGLALVAQPGPVVGALSSWRGRQGGVG
jgi:hypothetical protein